MERLIKKSSEVLIVSPYIDIYYAKFILRNSKNKRIYIISSSMDRKVKKLLEQGNFPATSLALFLTFSFAALIISAVGFGNFIFIFSILFLAIFLFRLKMRKPGGIKLKIPQNFVHAKLYIGNSMAIIGSANLTYRGLHKNVEHIEIHEDLEYIKKLKEEFWRMWKEVE
ncbi:MAG: phospholipase D-like domain-containing protein [Candidatus Micrarchaeia archaeon]